jgi:bla regulator protein blaR1
MIPNSLSAMWSNVAPTLGNHLWQSSLFAVLAGLVALFLRKNRARVRYGLWLAASLKFLIPFALLIFLGNHLSWSRSSATSGTSLYIAMRDISQPFDQTTTPLNVQPVSATVTASLRHFLPAVLAATWLCGFLMVLFVWCLRWRRISTMIHEAAPLTAGREVKALRRLEHIVGTQNPLEVRLLNTSLEPGIVGIARPVLLWPEGISERLEDSHLDAIFAHELSHVLRRDNLAATAHMLVEALVWFHPLVWWLGARLVEERERACDEAVLERGSDRKTYAESILRICEFCVGSPLTCVSGVTGADLKKRIVHIMTEGMTRKLDFSKKLLLSAAGLLAVAAPVVIGLLHATPTGAQLQAQDTVGPALAFAEVSISPSKSGTTVPTLGHGPQPGFADKNVTLRTLIRVAYGVQDSQILEGPRWLNSERYDIAAKLDESAADELQKLSREQRIVENKRMLQGLLADRFKLALHHETRELPIYALVIAENGPKVAETTAAASNSANTSPAIPTGFPIVKGHGIGMGDGRLTARGASISFLADILSRQPGVSRTVVDETKLTGNYDFTLEWSADGNAESIRTAVQDQLGLQLEPKTAPLEVLVIDHAEEPSEQ